MYPFLSGGFAAIDHLGDAVAFPTRAAMGPHCHTAFRAIGTWSTRTHALEPTIKIGYVSWFFLLAGAVSVLRATGRGRCRWEPATLLFVACLSPVWMCIASAFHPQDLIAMGFVLAATACARRDSWLGAGVLIALAILSQQFALLVAAPLLIVAPTGRRLRYAGAAVGTAALAVVPLIVVSAGLAMRPVLLGTGDSGGVGGTLVWELGLSGGPLVVLSRLVPIGLSLVIAWWTLRRLGAAALEPVPLLALLAVCVSLRLVFEQNLFGYYFMALAVFLVLLDMVSGRVRAWLVAWLAMVSVVFGTGPLSLDFLQAHWAAHVQFLIPFSAILLAVVLVVDRLLRHLPLRRLAPWLALLACALVAWNDTDPFGQPPRWLWQVILVPVGIALAAVPLLADVRPAKQHDNGQHIALAP